MGFLLWIENWLARNFGLSLSFNTPVILPPYQFNKKSEQKLWSFKVRASTSINQASIDILGLVQQILGFSPPHDKIEPLEKGYLCQKQFLSIRL